MYDNSDREKLNSYTLDTSKFDNQAAGVYEIGILPIDSSIKPITYSVTVKEKMDSIWKSIQFGQSTSAANNQTIVNEDGSAQLIALEGGGKVTEDHDALPSITPS